MKILVVDDYAPFAASLRLLLTRDEVTVAAGGREALALVRGGADFDAVLCDLRMRDVPGPEFYAHLAAERPDVAARVVFMTGGACDRATSEFLTASGSRCLLKPFTTGELAEALAGVAGASP